MLRFSPPPPAESAAEAEDDDDDEEEGVFFRWKDMNLREAADGWSGGACFSPILFPASLFLCRPWRAAAFFGAGPEDLA